MTGKGHLALRALVEFRLGGRLISPGARFTMPHTQGMRLVNGGLAELVPARVGRYRRRDMRAEDGTVG
jgi:hypothetical protein